MTALAMAPNTVPGYIICCTCCCLIMNIGLGFGFWAAGIFLRKAQAWEVPTAWRQTQCKVLVAGVSCTDEESRSTCGGYKAGQMPNQSVPVFLTEQIAVCPGTYWCAKEEEMCNCTGEITYSPELFDGYVYTVPAAEQAYKVRSDGLWKCGTDQMGLPYKVDPAPWHIKHCWCTPDGIQTILEPYGSQNLHKKECSESSNFDFEEANTRRLRRLAATQRARRLMQRIKERLDHASNRQLHNSRRRRTYRYTPWALVTVEDDALDYFSSSNNKPISCAYEYGVPQASGQFYHGDGPYSGGVWKAENVALKWGKDPVRPCWVRTQGESAGGYCSLALQVPGTLKEKARDLLKTVSILFWSCLCCTIVMLILCGVFFGPAVLQLCQELRAHMATRSQQTEMENLLNVGQVQSNAPNAPR